MRILLHIRDTDPIYPVMFFGEVLSNSLRYLRRRVEDPATLLFSLNHIRPAPLESGEEYPVQHLWGAPGEVRNPECQRVDRRSIQYTFDLDGVTDGASTLGPILRDLSEEFPSLVFNFCPENLSPNTIQWVNGSARIMLGFNSHHDDLDQEYMADDEESLEFEDLPYDER